MSLEAELKRRLDVSEQPLSKRLRLAEDLLSSSYFPVLNKDEIILNWIFSQIHNTSDNDLKTTNLLSLKNSLRKPINYKNFTAQFKSTIFQILPEFLKEENTNKQIVFECCLNFIENPSISSHLQQYIDDYFKFQTLLLNTLYENIKKETNKDEKTYETLTKRSLNDISNFTKNFGKKAVLVGSFINSKMLNIILELSNDRRFTYSCLNICQSILFPKPTIQLYRNYLGALIKGTSISSLIEEKGEALRTIVKVMDILFKYDVSDHENCNFLNNFIKLFLFCCKTEEIVILFFTVLLIHCVGVEQDYIQIHGDVLKRKLNEKDVQKIHLNLVGLLSEYSVNLNVTFSNDSSVDSERNFITFLQRVSLSILNDAELSTETLSIIKSVIILDPLIFEPLIVKILPKILTQHKNDNLMPIYNSTILIILEIQFKLSRGTEFIPKIMPCLNLELENVNKEQSEYIAKNQNVEKKKYTNKIITIEDVFPRDFCLLFGKLVSELMSWQNVNILNSLSDMLNEFCFKKISSENCAPSCILMAEAICSLLNSFFFHTKMADQSHTKNVVKNFMDGLECFEAKILGKFGRTIMETAECRLFHSFLDLVFTYGQFKLVLCKYQPYYSCPLTGGDGSVVSEKKAKKMTDVSMLHSYLSSSEWKNLFSAVKSLNDDKCNNALNRLILQKLTTLYVVEDDENAENLKSFIRTYIFENLNSFWNILIENNSNGGILLANLSIEEAKLFAKKTVLQFTSDNNSKMDLNVIKDFMSREFIKENKNVLSELILEFSRSLWNIFNDQKNSKNDLINSLIETSQMNNFQLKIFLKENASNFDKYIKSLSDSKLLKKTTTLENILNLFKLFGFISVEYLKENCQLLILFNIVILQILLKKTTENDNRVEIKNLEKLLRLSFFKIFNLSYKPPNVLDIFSLEILVQNDLINLTTVDKKNCVNSYIILQLIYERLICKEYVNQFDIVIRYLKTEYELLDDSLTHQDIIKCSIFQMISCLYASLTNYKKSSLPADIRSVVNKVLSDAKDMVLSVFNKIKWKSLNDNVEDDFKIAQLNLIECYTFLLQSKLDPKENEDVKQLKSLKKGLKLFLNLSMDLLSNQDACLHHAKGASVLLNMFLKNFDKLADDKVVMDRDDFIKNILTGLLCFIENSKDQFKGQWVVILNVHLENTRLIFELVDDKLFQELIGKYCSGDVSIKKSSNIKSSVQSKMHLTKILWTCLLNSILRSPSKKESRINVLKEICGSFRRICSDSETKDLSISGDCKDANIKNNELSKDNVTIREHLDKMAVCFQVACEFVTMKKIPLSNALIDNIMQMPMLLSMDSIEDSLSVFKEKFEMCTNLINSVLIHRSELLQDRWPCFLQSYRKILKSLCSRSHSDKLIDKNDVEIFVSMAVILERITNSMVKGEKQELTRISSYLIADIINCYHKIPVLPEVKFHIEKCVYSLFDLLDMHSIGFLMRNMQDSHRLIFQQIHENYKKYYKYTGMS